MTRLVIDEQRIAEIRERMTRLDDTALEDWMVTLDTVLHHDLPYLLNLLEELKGKQNEQD